MLLGRSAMCNQVWAGWGGQQSVRWKEFYSWLVPNTCAAPKNGYTTYMRGINTTEYRWYNLYHIETVNLSLNFVPIILFWYNMLIQHKSFVQTMIYNFYTVTHVVLCLATVRHGQYHKTNHVVSGRAENRSCTIRTFHVSLCIHHILLITRVTVCCEVIDCATLQGACVLF